MQGDPQILATLNRLLTGELSAADQYLYHAHRYLDWGLHALWERTHHEMEEERQHAQALIERILFLEGRPDVASRDPLALGSDGLPGGSGSAADTYAAGTLARLRVTGNAHDSLIAVGLDPRNSQYGDGDDVLEGGEGDDTMYGDDLGMAETDSGQDLMYGDAGNDKMYGGAKEDVLDGGAGNDKLYGGLGNDSLEGGDGNDSAYGGQGNDIYKFGSSIYGDYYSASQGADLFDGGKVERTRSLSKAAFQLQHYHHGSN